MSGMNNTSQDPDYVGPTGHEKKFHKTHFQLNRKWKRTHPKDDPTWEYVGVGRWRKTQRNAENAGDKPEVCNAVENNDIQADAVPRIETRQAVQENREEAR